MQRLKMNVKHTRDTASFARFSLDYSASDIDQVKHLWTKTSLATEQHSAVGAFEALPRTHHPEPHPEKSNIPSALQCPTTYADRLVIIPALLCLCQPPHEATTRHLSQTRAHWHRGHSIHMGCLLPSFSSCLKPEIEAGDRLPS